MTDMNSLINRFFLRETTPRENEDLAAWIEADAAHKAEFERAYDVFVLSQMLLGGNTISQVRKPRRHFSALFVKRAAAAVAVAAALVAGVVLGKE